MKVTAAKEHSDWAPVRSQRNSILMRTDRLMIPDFPISEEDRAEVSAYRTLLRDLMDGVAHPDDIVWPTVPAVVLQHAPVAPNPMQ